MTQAAVVIHGTAVMDVLSPDAYRARSGGANPNQALLQELLEAGTRVIVCGQSAASRGFAPSELADGVELALSAGVRRAPAGWVPRKPMVAVYLQRH